MRWSPPLVEPNRMTPSEFHDPPSKFGALHKAWAAPPATSTRFSLLLATKPIERESADQKTPLAFSVPGSSRAVKESIGRSHSVALATPFFWAVKARRRPSGEIA